MSLRQMEYFVAVVEEGSFTRAAQRLGVSQPALSHQVRALEQTVGQPLLERLPGSVLLTPMGRAYLPHAAAALRSAGEAARAGRPVRRSRRVQLRIATLYSIAQGIVPPAVRAWRAEHPLANIELREFANTESLLRHMALGLADVAVAPPPGEWDGPMRVIGEEDMVIVLAADDPVALAANRSEPISLGELRDRPWVLYAPENGLSAIVGQACELAGFVPRPAVRARHTATAVALAASGLGPTLAPRSIIEADFDGAMLVPDPPVRRQLVAMTMPNTGRLVADFVDLLAEQGATRARGRDVVATPGPTPG